MSGDVEAAWRYAYDVLDDYDASFIERHARPAIEAAIRAAALDEARAAIYDLRRYERIPLTQRRAPIDRGDALAAIDALRERSE